MNHTPEPWTAKLGASDDGHSECWIITDQNGIKIAEVNKRVFRKGYDPDKTAKLDERYHDQYTKEIEAEGEANAKLIADAPKLFALMNNLPFSE